MRRQASAGLQPLDVIVPTCSVGDNEHINHLCIMAATLLGVPLVAFVRAADALNTRDYPRTCPADEAPSLLKALRTLCSPAMPAAVATPFSGKPPVNSAQLESYVGVPLLNAAGETVGCLCAVSRRPRKWSAHDFNILTTVRGLVLLALELHDSERRKRDDIADIVHDLRQPLALIAISAEVLSLAGAQNIQPHCEKVRESVKTMKLMINGLIDGSHAAAAPATQPIDLGRLVDTLLHDYGPAAAQLGLTLKSTVAANLPALHCDPAQLQRVFSNLIGNALKFAKPASSIHITGDVRDGDIEFSIVNEGVGIAADDMAHVFERRWQATPQGEGRGLGLAIVANILKEQGGSIAVRSLAGTTAFSFKLPLMPASACMDRAELHAA